MSDAGLRRLVIINKQVTSTVAGAVSPAVACCQPRSACRFISTTIDIVVLLKLFSTSFNVAFGSHVVE